MKSTITCLSLWLLSIALIAQNTNGGPPKKGPVNQEKNLANFLFLDDFSYGTNNVVYPVLHGQVEEYNTTCCNPDYGKWETGSETFVASEDMAYFAPTPGVLILDGRQNLGLQHGASEMDVLTSRPIDLSNYIAGTNTLYFSFYYQPRGSMMWNSEVPFFENSAGSELILEFKWRDAIGTEGWDVIETIQGEECIATWEDYLAAVFPFQKAGNFTVAESKYFIEDFQFRFKAKIVETDCDHVKDVEDSRWVIDYVSLTESEIVDVGFARSPKLLKNYSTMPWQLFYDNLENELSELNKILLYNAAGTPVLINDAFWSVYDPATGVNLLNDLTVNPNADNALLMGAQVTPQPGMNGLYPNGILPHLLDNLKTNIETLYTGNEPSVTLIKQFWFSETSPSESSTPEFPSISENNLVQDVVTFGSEYAYSQGEMSSVFIPRFIDGQHNDDYVNLYTKFKADVDLEVGAVSIPFPRQFNPPLSQNESYTDFAIWAWVGNFPEQSDVPICDPDFTSDFTYEPVISPNSSYTYVLRDQVTNAPETFLVPAGSEFVVAVIQTSGCANSSSGKSLRFTISLEEDCTSDNFGFGGGQWYSFARPSFDPDYTLYDCSPLKVQTGDGFLGGITFEVEQDEICATDCFGIYADVHMPDGSVCAEDLRMEIFFSEGGTDEVGTATFDTSTGRHHVKVCPTFSTHGTFGFNVFADRFCASVVGYDEFEITVHPPVQVAAVEEICNAASGVVEAGEYYGVEILSGHANCSEAVNVSSTGDLVDFIGVRRVVLKNETGFHATQGSHFKARVEPSGCYEEGVQEEEPADRSADGGKEPRWIDPALFKAFPNPFSDDLIFEYSVESDRAIPVTLEIISMSGQVMTGIIDHEMKSNGTYRERVTGGLLSPGVHFACLRLDGHKVYRKIVKVD